MFWGKGGKGRLTKGEIEKSGEIAMKAEEGKIVVTLLVAVGRRRNKVEDEKEKE